MRRAEIESQNRYLLERQRQYRIAADVLVEAWTPFEEVAGIAVIGSVAKALWMEVPRFREYRREGIEVWHECGDLDIALWVTSQHRLGKLRDAAARALRNAFEAGRGISMPSNELDAFLFEPGSDRYLGRLCKFSQCPKGKLDCLVPGCGDIPFNRKFEAFSPRRDLLASLPGSMLFRRGEGTIRSALDLPTPDAAGAPKIRRQGAGA